LKAFADEDTGLLLIKTGGYGTWNSLKEDMLKFTENIGMSTGVIANSKNGGRLSSKNIRSAYDTLLKKERDAMDDNPIYGKNLEDYMEMPPPLLNQSEKNRTLSFGEYPA